MIKNREGKSVIPTTTCCLCRSEEDGGAVCVLNPYCDLNKAIANRASYHPIWKR